VATKPEKKQTLHQGKRPNAMQGYGLLVDSVPQNGQITFHLWVHLLHARIRMWLGQSQFYRQSRTACEANSLGTWSWLGHEASHYGMQSGDRNFQWYHIILEWILVAYMQVV
jgi:hypothetical protein